MRILFRAASVFLLIANTGWAASKPHVITFGKWTAIKWYAGPNEDQPIEAKARPIFVDSKLKEFTLGTPHEVTEHLFVVRRVLHINDSLPQEPVVNRWTWQPGGWLIVDRVSGHIASLALPDFDPFTSNASWYRDYIAYCGQPEDHKKLNALVIQIGRHKPVLKKSLADVPDEDGPGCGAPEWQRQPARVTFEPRGAAKSTFAIRRNTIEPLREESEDEPEN